MDPRRAHARFSRPLTRVLWGALLALGVGSASVAGAPPAHAETGGISDFSFASWDVAMTVGTTAEGRAIAHVTETIVAEFPEHDQNRGMVRMLPQQYLDAHTDPRDFSVTTLDGEPVPFEVESGEDVDEHEGEEFIAVLTGTDEYVHGTQSFVISYTLDDVILARDDHRADELYWDMIPLNRAQPIAAASVTVTFDEPLAAKLTGQQRCYVGAFEATSECEIAQVTGDTAGTIQTAPVALAAHAGLTVAIGLSPGAVVQPPSRLPDFTLDTLPLVLGGGALVTAGLGSLGVARLRRERKGHAPIIAEYDVPEHLPPLLAGPIAGASRPTPPAELVHLAVLGATRIEELPGKPGRSSKKTRLAFRLLAPGLATDPLDAKTLRALFPSGKVGSLREVPKEDADFGERMSKLAASGAAAALERGYVERVRSPLGRALGWVSLALAAITLTLALVGVATRFTATPAVALIIALAAAALGVFSLARHKVLTPEGARARTALLGVREFIRVAEADRLRVLQSTKTAERVAAGEHAVIHLYERLLPYAMLFGLEREWGKTLATQYEQFPNYLPVWYPAMLTGGVGQLSSSIAQFSSSISSAATYSASSSGGSTGGGFAGGGGGGGFAGGR